MTTNSLVDVTVATDVVTDLTDELLVEVGLSKKLAMIESSLIKTRIFKNNESTDVTDN